MIRQDEFERNRLFTRRAFMLTSSGMTMFTVLAGRMYYMQALDSEEYRTLSEKNRISLVTVFPKRGDVIDRNNKFLALSSENFQVILDKIDNLHCTKTVDFLVNLLKLEDSEKIYRNFRKTSFRGRVVLLDRISWEQMALIEENLVNLPGVLIEKNMQRLYPYDYSTSHLIGYLGSINEADKKTTIFQNIGEYDIGKAGLEKRYEDDLRGSFGFRKMEVNAHGLFIRELSENKSVPGKTLNTTIDIDIQKEIYEKISIHPGGSAIAMDITNGDILTFISSPGFDPNRFVGGVSEQYWTELLNNEFKPLVNRSVNNTYPPGSIFKLIVMLAALGQGVSPDFRVNCPGYMIVGSRKFRCWYRPGHGTINMYDALKHSCNIYMYTAAKMIGIDPIADTAREFGLGEKTGICMLGESEGFIPDRAWKMSKLKQPWQLGDTVNTSIGQGYTLVTPIQLATMTSGLANGGKILRPNFIKGEKSKIIKSAKVKQEHLEVILQSMINVVNSQGGTAFGSRIIDTEFKMAGKTGTAQVISKKDDNHNLSSDSVYWKYRNHGLFVGFAPFDNPKFACSIVVDHGGSGSGAAAPIGRDLLYNLVKKYS